jgi:periplasmic divalent cation tolerance protein
MPEYIQVMTTVEKKDDAEAIATALLTQRLAACVQILGPATSYFWWHDAIDSSTEFLCLIKSRADLMDEIEAVLREIHPYEVPEILGLPVVDGGRDYLQWLEKELRP